MWSETFNTRTLEIIEDSWCEVKDGYCFSGKKASGVPYKAIRSEFLEIWSLSTHYNCLPSRQFIGALSKIFFAILTWRNTRRTKMGVVYDLNKHSQKKPKLRNLITQKHLLRDNKTLCIWILFPTRSPGGYQKTILKVVLAKDYIIRLYYQSRLVCEKMYLF